MRNSGTNSRRWQPGEQILQQELWWGSLLLARPVTVVEDRQDLLALYTHRGAPYRTASAFRASHENRYTLSVEERVTIMMGDLQPFEERVSRTYHVLTLTPPDSWHSVRLFWSADWELHFWYVNLQSPIQFTDHGILGQDYILDILVSPDFSWVLKDEDEFSERHRRGFLDDEVNVLIPAESDRMIEAIERRDSPFCDGWEHWRPHQEWPIPDIPSNWETVGQVINSERLTCPR